MIVLKCEMWLSIRYDCSFSNIIEDNDILFTTPPFQIAPMRKLNDLKFNDLIESFKSYCTMCFYIYWCSVCSQSLSCAY